MNDVSDGSEVGEDDVETEADLLEGDIAVAEVRYIYLTFQLKC